MAGDEGSPMGSNPTTRGDADRECMFEADAERVTTRGGMALDLLIALRDRSGRRPASPTLDLVRSGLALAEAQAVRHDSDTPPSVVARTAELCKSTTSRRFAAFPSSFACLAAAVK